ncbi:MAG: hypothetical protein JW882_16475 [Deltaproteobacteria bacterium]|nr:hypothetical protein [Deltaproteobacteria bacterium]
MGNEVRRGVKSLDITPEKEEEIIRRCFNMVDYLNDIAVDLITDFIHNSTCPLAKQVLRNSPETIAVKSFEKAIDQLSHEIRRNDLKII